MPFFPPQAYLNSEPTLFQILSALDPSSGTGPTQQQKKRSPAACTPSAAAAAAPARRSTPIPIQSKAQAQSQAQQPFITPRFDVAETQGAYELYGELPGITQEEVTIEFSDVQTLVIKGRTQRPTATSTSTTSTSTSTTPTGPTTSPAAAGAEEQRHEEQDEDTKSEKSYHSATVEDEYDEADTPLSAATLTPPASSAASAASTDGTIAVPVATPTAAAPASEKKEAVEEATYWVTERRFGEFARSFSFEQRIDQDAVRASLRNGVLHVVVPKSQKPKRVLVQVN